MVSTSNVFLLPFLSAMMTLTKTKMKQLDELFDFQSVVVEPGDTLHERANKKIQDISQSPDIILVDLSFGTHEYPEEVQIGWELASKLAQEYPKSAVGVYTRHPILPYYRANISSDRFPLMLESLHQAYDGPNKMRGDDWYDLFDKILKYARSQREALPYALTGTYGTGVTKWAPSHPHHRSLSFIKAACNLVDLALDWLKPAPTEILITQLGGGFSGSFVVKAEIPSWPKSYIVKIDEDPSKLVKELEGYRTVQTFIEHRYYLPLLGINIRRPVVLSRGLCEIPFD